MKKNLIFLVFFLIFPLLISGCGSSGGGNPLAGGFLALQVSAGDFHTCAVQSSGQVKCWGVNGSGQLGNGTQVGSFTPVTVSGLSNAVEVSAGGAHSCARLNDNTIECWGDNSFGQLGNGSTVPFPTPVQVTGITNAVGISAGENHTCAVLSDGTVWCWGLNSSGQLGNGTQNTSLIPVKVSGITTAMAVSAGGSSASDGHTCALLADGTVFCWGNNSFGQLGNGTSASDTPPTPGFSDTPIQANLTGATAVSIAAGADHTCAAISDGTVKCWGNNFDGQLGNPYTTSPFSLVPLTFSTFPIPVFGVSDASGVTAGSGHSCANLSGGGVQCWGDDLSGQLGNGAFFGSAPVDPINLPNTTWQPVSVINLSTVTQVDAGALHTCAHLSNNVIACWGDNGFGQLGIGNFNTSNFPIGVVD